ncbi:MAG: threonylcarbamoyl-AMP synthase [Burkholderiales bacterium]|nr:threonylcarbamoyl-AMP synthase [Bacteroidia bacterium]
MAEIGNNVSIAKAFLEQDQLVAIPTETVYGLAANALNPIAVAKIFEAKERPTFDPLIVHTYNLDQVYKFITEIHPSLLKLAEVFWPGPLTLLLPKKSIIPDLVTSGLDRVGVRIPNHPLTIELLSQVSFPLAAPSANPFGYISPTKAEHVQKQLGDKIQYILDGGDCTVGLESTIVGEENGEIFVYRLGGLAIDDIEQVIGKVSVQLNQSSNPKAPGQLKSHYAPVKPFYMGSLNELQKKYAHKKIGAVVFGGHSLSNESILIKNLSVSKNYREAAVNLFSFLRELDESNVEVIICDFLPEEGLGLAINDRLKRAAAI